MTREEAQRECTRLASESPDRETHTFLPREGDGGQWSVVKVGVAPPAKVGGTSVEARPRPEQLPEDTRPAHNPYWAGG
jgi:hypothetical protein